MRKMPRELYRKEVNIICHDTFLGHIKVNWDIYRNIVDINIVNKSLLLVKESEVKKLIELALTEMKEVTGLDSVASRLPSALGATPRLLFNLVVWICMSLETSDAPPTKQTVKGLTCTK